MGLESATRDEEKGERGRKENKLVKATNWRREGDRRDKKWT